MASPTYTGTRIRPGAGAANITLQLSGWSEPYSFACILNRLELDSVIPLQQALTFCNETAPNFEAGTETLSWRIGGWGTFNDVRSTPFIPPPQDVPAVFTCAPGCTVSGTVDFSRGTFMRQAGGSAVLTGEGVFDGQYALIWDIAA